MSKRTHIVALSAVIAGSGVAAMVGGPTGAVAVTAADAAGVASTTPGGAIAQSFDIGGGRTLYLECSGEGSPLILLEAGDESGIDEWQPVHASLAAETRTCAYDRAGIGQSSEATGCRGVDELLGDLEALLAAAELAGPYLLVGTSGGGFLMAGFAARHPDQVAGLVLLETPKAITISSLPAEVRADITCDSPINLERRDYIAVEHDVWDARTEIGEFPMTIVSNDYGPEAQPGDEQTNVVDQQTWLVLSPNSKQVVVTSGHDVVWNESALVLDEIRAVLAAASESAGESAAAATIVGTWHRAQSCEEMLAVFEAAGLAESHLGWLQGNFFGGGPGPTEGDVCAGAQGPLEHDHFFTDDGAFGSHDENGEQVDDGDYEVVDGDSLAFPSHASEFGYDGVLTVDYEITADVLTFDVVLPDPCEDTCKDAYAWALSAFASGPWSRGEIPR
jgi:alpha/beta hydrolase family protein